MQYNMGGKLQEILTVYFIVSCSPLPLWPKQGRCFFFIQNELSGYCPRSVEKVQKSQTAGSRGGCTTLPETNIFAENKPRVPQKKKPDRFPSTIFQGHWLLV